MRDTAVNALNASAMGAPFCVTQSVPAESRAHEMVFYASEIRDFAGAACSELVFDFGDGSKPVSSNRAVQTHVVRESGAFEVHVTCVDVALVRSSQAKDPSCCIHVIASSF